ncbi:methyl-accepting chemotaxis protein [Aneurinibacillus thermoaerophilus]|uniref:Methyl-accepting chemotaxis protein n=1 Tax=Aneurinibacillus thermoaerophilus TaxID=143495 RepID=A0ABX8YCI3_ANETH|nr:methyl-accepting chemotaxis protein [Aneurinibacillus thermoaerophilus]MED0681354.1 methyl-accepting chemotaxis protein [Aneurinibacillus thermoaerophilus]MED0765689.1 methyl-accepting chemotaxis protein [Aneurinibacillus thermoaerophilus]QYY43222.1 methyl-accepting chemotaxis protein [Aneurinibacillus thermoaerophilus]
MRFRSIKTRILVSLLPTFIIVLLFITLFTYFYSKSLINGQIETNMHQQLQSITNKIEKDLITHKKMPELVARTAEFSALSYTKEQYSAMLKNALGTNKETLGMGIFFEPYKYKPDVKYFSLYAHRKGDNIEITEEFNNPEYDYPNTDWYQTGKNSKQPAVYTDPYFDTVTNTSMVTVSVPFYSQQREFLGIITCDIDLASLQKMINSTKVGDTGRAFLLDSKGTYLADADKNKMMKVNIKNDPNSSLAQTSSHLLSGNDGMVTYNDKQGVNRIYYKRIPENNWVLALIIPEEELLAPVHSLVNALILTTVIAIAITIAIILLYSRYITNNIERVNQLSAAMSDGDFTQNIEVKTEDEFGQMFRNFNIMTRTLKDMMGQIASHTHQVASTSEQLTAGSEQTSKATEQITESMMEVASGTDQQVSIVEDAKKVVSEISESMTSIMREIQQVNERARIAAEKAENGNHNAKEITEQINNIHQRVEKLAQAIRELGEKSKEITHIVSLITSISEQTNLLALNAAIEAARAGEHGRGFSIVADEVRKLAEQSAQSAGQIGHLIAEIQHETHQAIEMMNEANAEVEQGMVMVDSASQSFEDILKAAEDVFAHAKEVNTIVEQINTEKENMTEAVSKIALISEQTAELTQSVAAAAEEQNASMEEIASASHTLTKMAEELHDLMSKFKV